MKKQQISKHIRRIYLAKLVPAVLFLIFTGYIMYHYPFQKILLPNHLSNINRIFDAYQSGQEFLELTVPNLYYTGYDYTINSVKKGSYYYSFIDNQCVFFLLTNDTSKQSASELNHITFKSKLITDASNRQDLIEHFASDLSWSETELGKISSHFIVSEFDYFVPQAYALLLFIGIVDLFTILSVLGYLLSIIAPHASSVCKHFDKRKVAKQALIKADFELKHNREFSMSDISITPNYLICLNRNRVEFIPLDKIIWTYKHSTMSKFFGFSYNLTIHSSNGVSKFKHMQKFEADSILEYFSNNHSNILIGYTKENVGLYKQQCKRR